MQCWQRRECSLPPDWIKNSLKYLRTPGLPRDPADEEEAEALWCCLFHWKYKARDFIFLFYCFVPRLKHIGNRDSSTIYGEAHFRFCQVDISSFSSRNLLFVFANYGEDDDEDQTDGDGHKENKKCGHLVCGLEIYWDVLLKTGKVGVMRLIH